MKQTLRILLLEDMLRDVHLIEHELSDAGFQFQITRIETEAELRGQLESEKPDLVLSDHGLPSFNGFAALEIVREIHPDLPFIFVSGSNNQAMILEMFEKGATDYVFKKDIHDLVAAVRGALEKKPDTKPRPTEQTPAAKPNVNTVSSAANFVSPAGYLSFCPGCLGAWDETGQSVKMEKYLGTHMESVIFRKLCPACVQLVPRC